MPLLFTVIRAVIRILFMTKRAILLENLALRQQLAAYRRTSLRARLRPSDRVFWVGLSKLWDGWQSALVIVKPETVIRWHRKGFQLFWRRKSRSGKVGRPRIPRRHIEFIKRMSADNPGQILGTSRRCLASPIAGRMGLRDTPRPLLSRGSLDGLSLANTHGEFAVGWNRARADGNRLGGHPRGSGHTRLSRARPHLTAAV